MEDRHGPDDGRDEEDDLCCDYEKEVKCEFLDPRFLAVTALDSEHAALDYFYQSPFYLKYRELALNEYVRAGTPVDSEHVGLMFQVTYSNLDDIAEALKNLPPLDELARIQYYSNAAIFHITLFSRNLGRNGVATTPVKVYYIMQGSIFVCPLFGSLIRRHLHQAVEQFEKFYDTINNISRWSLANGYSWEPKQRALDVQIENLCHRYGFKEENDQGFTKEGGMNLFFLKPQDRIANRVAHDEIQRMARRLAEVHKKAMENSASGARQDQRIKNTTNRT
ncbi:uncharacterized protein BXIN_0838 [Babesia sp. Xinjiang]|uniref:uncharacterized protein n=1 Tax=Babesia sp. Xinjiang TaxID=462227 RepID=UPI000A229EF8|nr:uncharacterized protein BXIN_0838 [Babesia sp. Xinjiang]ORM41296.1 hypothetical protein BXIN_0838 [Babesia sp. Xinjiang]